MSRFGKWKKKNGLLAAFFYIIHFLISALGGRFQAFFSQKAQRVMDGNSESSCKSFLSTNSPATPQRCPPKTFAQINIQYQWCVTVLIGSTTTLHLCPSVKTASKSRPCNTMWGDEAMWALLICCTGPNVCIEQNKHPLDSHWKTEQVGSCICCGGAHISNPASTLLNWVSIKHVWVCYQRLVALLLLNQTVHNTMGEHSLLC